MQPIGYIILQHGVRFDHPAKAFQRWIERIPHIYNFEVTPGQEATVLPTSQDPNRLARLKHYQSLMPMAQESRKPIFHLKPADGAMGSHLYAVRDVYQDFKKLAQEIAHRTELRVPQSQPTLEPEMH
ncbi:hypothetical protein [Lyngbya confervoides]|uniref:Uncharacterized protein n=1 Tax=Lyngbya confervoides BDU141951 TaxID=1574623 RepID=A0ABD4T5A2_9CYAN|nr:hypothetical protein [Lyngbya confervoides]MCM1983621.1 hypothetical protein [Lyngbya confervoides BDU141951]